VSCCSFPPFKLASGFLSVVVEKRFFKKTKPWIQYDLGYMNTDGELV
jgi:hypothetical protein